MLKVPAAFQICIVWTFIQISVISQIVWKLMDVQYSTKHKHHFEASSAHHECILYLELDTPAPPSLAYNFATDTSAKYSPVAQKGLSQ